VNRWLLSGPIQGDSSVTPSLLTRLTPAQESDELVDSLQRFWETESLGIIESVLEEPEFDKIIRFSSSEGRYVVSLPWVSLRLSSNNYSECLSRLSLLRSRLIKNVDMLHEYETTFSRQLEMGIIKPYHKQNYAQNLIFTCLIMVWYDSRRKLQNYVLCSMAPQRQNRIYH